MWWLARESVKRFSRFKTVEVGLQHRRNFDCRSREDIFAYQVTRFNQLWETACSTIPYYQKISQELDLPRAFTSIEDISKNVPILEKSEIQKNPHLFYSAQSAPGFWASTSGSTGTPMRCYWTHQSYIESQQDKYYYQSLWGIDIWDRTANLWGYSHFFEQDLKGKTKFIKDKVAEKIRNKVNFSVYEISPENLRRWYKHIDREHVHLLYALPNVACLMAQVNQGHPPPKNLNLVIVGGEPLFPEQRQQIESVFGCPVAIEYGTIEMGLIAAAYPDGAIHGCDRGVLIETKPTSHGTFELIVTNLRNSAFPLIRYRIGDSVAAPIHFPALGTSTLTPIMGRIRDVLVTSSGKVVNGLVFSRLFKDFPTVSQYQVVQKSPTQVSIDLVCWQPLSAAMEQLICKKAIGILGQDMVVSLRQVAKIEPTKAGKHKFIINQASTPLLTDL